MNELTVHYITILLWSSVATTQLFLTLIEVAIEYSTECIFYPVQGTYKCIFIRSYGGVKNIA